jgi:Clp amino terminal domain, pathogenicity island component
MLFSVFERFTEQARQVFVSAQEHARELQHRQVGTEHLLLAVVVDGGELPALALSSFGIDQSHVRAAVIELVGVGGRRPGHVLPFTPRTKEALEMALRESLSLGHMEIRPGHVLLGLVRDEDAVAVRVLLDLGVSLGSLRDAVVELLEDPVVRDSELKQRPRTATTATSARRLDSDHVGPPDMYLVTRAVTPSEAPEDVRGLAEAALNRVGLLFDDVAFVAEVRDADLTGPLAHPEWLVAAHGPSPRPGMIVRSVGSWASASHRTSFGGKRSGTILRVGTIDRVELSDVPLAPPHNNP